MAFQLPADLEQRIESQLRGGEFHSPADVLRAAMDTLEQRQRGLRQLSDMVKEADADIAAGRVGPFDVEVTKRAVRELIRDGGGAD